MVRLQLNKKIKKNIKLTGLLIGNEKKLMLCSFVSVIVGFTFMFMVSSLSGTIIKTKQDNTVNKYGKFLMVLPDIDNESEKEIKQKCIDFKYEHFGVVGNVEYANKKITIGTMTEDMGATLAFKLIKGKWVKGSDQIVVEEYLLKLFGKENTQLPFDIKLKQAVETHFDFVAANPQIPFFIINELLTNPKRLHDFRKMFGSIASSTLERIQSEINIEIQKGSIKPINAIDLIFDIISLNIFTFLVSPVIFGNKDILPKEIHEEFIQKRREEHVKLILARIKY